MLDSLFRYKTTTRHRPSLIGVLVVSMFYTSYANSDYPAAPGFNLPTANGEVSLEQLKGKLVYIDFWASWCRPCMQSFPWMIEIKEKFRDKPFEIVAINLDDNKVLADEFISSQPINFIVAFDPKTNIAKSYGIDGMPSSYLVDPEGNLRYRFTGFWNRSKDEKEKIIRDLLKQY